jgi:hypothetical protein
MSSVRRQGVGAHVKAIAWHERAVHETWLKCWAHAAALPLDCVPMQPSVSRRSDRTSSALQVSALKLPKAGGVAAGAMHAELLLLLHCARMHGLISCPAMQPHRSQRVRYHVLLPWVVATCMKVQGAAGLVVGLTARILGVV